MSGQKITSCDNFFTIFLFPGVSNCGRTQTPVHCLTRHVFYDNANAAGQNPKDKVSETIFCKSCKY
jgi:hypothetical protein